MNPRILLILTLMPAISVAQSNEWKLSQYIATLNSCLTTLQFVGKDLICHTPVTSITAGTGLTGGTITTTGTLAVDQAFSPTWTGTHTFSNPITVNGGGSVLKGGVTISAPSVGTALSISPGADVPSVVITGAAGQRAGIDLQGNAGAGTQLSIFQDSSNNARIFNRANTQLDFSTNGFSRMQISAGGDVSISSPTSGTAFVVNASSTGVGEQINGSAGSFGLLIAGSSTASQSYGIIVEAGTSSGDAAFVVKDQTATKTFLLNRGDGSGFLGTNAANGGLNWTTGNAFTISAPSSGNALSVLGQPNSFTQIITGSSTSGQSFGMQLNAGTNSSDTALAVKNQASSSTFFNVRGDGAVQFPLISTTASAANAFIDNANSNNLLRSTSSIRYKQDVHTLDVANEVLKLRPIRYRSKAAADDPKLWWYGLIAEEVAKVDPRLIFTDAQGRPDGVQYDRIGVLTLGVVQRQQRELQLLWTVVGLLAVWNLYLTFRRQAR